MCFALKLFAILMWSINACNHWNFFIDRVILYLSKSSVRSIPAFEWLFYATTNHWIEYFSLRMRPYILQHTKRENFFQWLIAAKEKLCKRLVKDVHLVFVGDKHP